MTWLRLSRLLPFRLSVDCWPCHDHSLVLSLPFQPQTMAVLAHQSDLTPSQGTWLTPQVIASYCLFSGYSPFFFLSPKDLTSLPYKVSGYGPMPIA
jgi:hypothetical protein